MADWLEAFLAMRVHALIRFGRWSEHRGTAAARGPEAVLRDDRDAPLRPRRRALGHRPDRRGRGRARTVPRGGRPGSGDADAVQQHLRRHPRDRRRRCSTANWSTARATTRPPSPPWNGPSNWTTTFPTTSRGAGCSPPATRTAPCSSNRAASRRPKPSTGPTWASTTRCLAPCQHPSNVWALHGFHECLVRLGRTGEARIVAQQLKIATASADVPVEASCFCRLEVAAEGDGRGRVLPCARRY